jgi:hypothetical protein
MAAPVYERLFTCLGPGRYRLAILELGVVLDIDRLRLERDQYHGELSVMCEAAAARSVDGGYLSIADFNLSSARERVIRAKLLGDKARVNGIDWSALLEELTQKALTAERVGQPAVDLRSLDPPTPADIWTVDGLELLKRHPMILFGDGGTAKSYLALYLAGALARQGIPVLYADWELAGEEHRDRLERLFGLSMPRVLYARCERPLATEVDRLHRIIREERVGYVVCDSIAFACDGPPEAAETAGTYFRALRQFGVGSLHIAHVNRGEQADQKPFGSSFWHNGARSTWYVKKSEDGPVNLLTVGLFHRKANLGPLSRPLGFTLNFAERTTDVIVTDIRSIADLASSLPLWQRVATVLKNEGPKTTAQLAAALDTKEPTIARTVRRLARKFRRAADPTTGILTVSLNAPRAYFGDDPPTNPTPTLPLDDDPPPLTDEDLSTPDKLSATGRTSYPKSRK